MAAKQKSSTTAQKRRRRLPRWVALSAAATLLTVAGLFLVPKILAAWARHRACEELEVWAIGAAQIWLARAAWLDTTDARADLLQAVCFRRLEQMDRFSGALQTARSKGAPASAVERETKLALVQAGEFYSGAETELAALIDAGASAQDVGTAFLKGYLASDDSDRARMLLETWQTEFPGDANLSYMWGVYRQWQGERGLAEAEFQKALARQPRHESALAALANVLQQQDRLQEALPHYLEWTILSPETPEARLGLAGVLRKLNRFREARSILDSLADREKLLPLALMEMARFEFESGNYTEAGSHFQQLSLDGSSDSTLLLAAGANLAVDGYPDRSELYFARAAVLDARMASAYDLRAKLALDPGNRELESQLQAVSKPLISSTSEEATSTAANRADRNHDSAPTAAGLYATHCAACHGAGGDGQGRAARHLFPKPRDFHYGKFRLVSTRNGAATEDDLQIVLRRGMPGTAMRAYDDLTDNDRSLLVVETLRLFREGLRSQYVTLLESEGDEIDKEEIELIVADSARSGEVVDVPQIGDFSEQAAARGRELYLSLGCNNCHGDSGVGAWDVWLSDDTGLPSRPRDLVREPFKGGSEPESIYLRIALGMPGTPHPASLGVIEEQLIDLVQYCRSLAAEPKRNLTNFERAMFATGDAYLAEFADSVAP